VVRDDDRDEKEEDDSKGVIMTTKRRIGLTRMTKGELQNKEEADVVVPPDNVFCAFLFCNYSGAIVVHDFLICVLRASFAIHGSITCFP
jgi:hypothetical protein